MKVQQVKINPWNRIKILCSYCEEFHHEMESYAIVEQKFRYICHDCLSSKISQGRNIEVLHHE